MTSTVIPALADYEYSYTDPAVQAPVPQTLQQPPAMPVKIVIPKVELPDIQIPETPKSQNIDMASLNSFKATGMNLQSPVSVAMTWTTPPSREPQKDMLTLPLGGLTQTMIISGDTSPKINLDNSKTPSLTTGTKPDSTSVQPPSNNRSTVKGGQDYKKSDTDKDLLKDKSDLKAADQLGSTGGMISAFINGFQPFNNAETTNVKQPQDDKNKTEGAQKDKANQDTSLLGSGAAALQKGFPLLSGGLAAANNFLNGSNATNNSATTKHPDMMVMHPDSTGKDQVSGQVALTKDQANAEALKNSESDAQKTKDADTLKAKEAQGLKNTKEGEGPKDQFLTSGDAKKPSVSGSNTENLSAILPKKDDGNSTRNLLNLGTFSNSEDAAKDKYSMGNVLARSMGMPDTSGQVNINQNPYVLSDKKDAAGNRNLSMSNEPETAGSKTTPQNQQYLQDKGKLDDTVSVAGTKDQSAGNSNSGGKGNGGTSGGSTTGGSTGSSNGTSNLGTGNTKGKAHIDYHYDAAGNIESWDSYDTSGKLVKTVTEGPENYNLDAAIAGSIAAHVPSATYLNGSTATFTYQADGTVTVHLTYLGKTYDSTSGTYSTSWQTSERTYNAKGQLLTELKTIDGMPCLFTYDPGTSRVTGFVNQTTGETKSYQYDNNGHLTSYKDKNGKTTSIALPPSLDQRDANYSFDSSGNLVCVASKNGQLCFYDSTGKITQFTDAEGYVVVATDWDANGHVIRGQSEHWGDMFFNYSPDGYLSGSYSSATKEWIYYSYGNDGTVSEGMHMDKDGKTWTDYYTNGKVLFTIKDGDITVKGSKVSESQAKTIITAYFKKMLGRDATKDEIDQWMAACKSGDTYSFSEMTKTIKLCDEYLTKMIKDAYTTSMGRDASQDEINSIMTQIRAGKIKTDEISKALENNLQEFRNGPAFDKKLQSLYERYFRRGAAAAEIEYWRDLVKSGKVLVSEIETWLMKSDEYKSNPASESAMYDLLKKYLGIENPTIADLKRLGWVDETGKSVYTINDLANCLKESDIYLFRVLGDAKNKQSDPMHWTKPAGTNWFKMIVCVVISIVVSWIPGLNVIVAGALVGALCAMVNGGNILQGAIMGAVTAVAASAVQAAADGIKAVANGGEFASTAATSFTSTTTGIFAETAGMAGMTVMSAVGQLVVGVAKAVGTKLLQKAGFGTFWSAMGGLAIGAIASGLSQEFNQGADNVHGAADTAGTSADLGLGSNFVSGFTAALTNGTNTLGGFVSTVFKSAVREGLSSVADNYGVLGFVSQTIGNGFVSNVSNSLGSYIDSFGQNANGPGVGTFGDGTKPGKGSGERQGVPDADGKDQSADGPGTQGDKSGLGETGLGKGMGEGGNDGLHGNNGDNGYIPQGNNSEAPSPSSDDHSGSNASNSGQAPQGQQPGQTPPPVQQPGQTPQNNPKSDDAIRNSSDPDDQKDQQASENNNLDQPEKNIPDATTDLTKTGDGGKDNAAKPETNDDRNLNKGLNAPEHKNDGEPEKHNNQTQPSKPDKSIGAEKQEDADAYKKDLINDKDPNTPKGKDEGTSGSGQGEDEKKPDPSKNEDKGGDTWYNNLGRTLFGQDFSLIISKTLGNAFVTKVQNYVKQKLTESFMKRVYAKQYEDAKNGSNATEDIKELSSVAGLTVDGILNSNENYSKSLQNLADTFRTGTEDTINAKGEKVTNEYKNHGTEYSHNQTTGVDIMTRVGSPLSVVTLPNGSTFIQFPGNMNSQTKREELEKLVTGLNAQKQDMDKGRDKFDLAAALHAGQTELDKLNGTDSASSTAQEIMDFNTSGMSQSEQNKIDLAKANLYGQMKQWQDMAGATARVTESLKPLSSLDMAQASMAVQAAANAFSAERGANPDKPMDASIQATVNNLMQKAIDSTASAGINKQSAGTLAQYGAQAASMGCNEAAKTAVKDLESYMNSDMFGKSSINEKLNFSASISKIANLDATKGGAEAIGGARTMLTNAIRDLTKKNLTDTQKLAAATLVKFCNQDFAKELLNSISTPGDLRGKDKQDYYTLLAGASTGDEKTKNYQKAADTLKELKPDSAAYSERNLSLVANIAVDSRNSAQAGIMNTLVSSLPATAENMTTLASLGSQLIESNKATSDSLLKAAAAQALDIPKDASQVTEGKNAADKKAIADTNNQAAAQVLLDARKNGIGEVNGKSVDAALSEAAAKTQDVKLNLAAADTLQADGKDASANLKAAMANLGKLPSADQTVCAEMAKAMTEGPGSEKTSNKAEIKKEADQVLNNYAESRMGAVKDAAAGLKDGESKKVDGVGTVTAVNGQITVQQQTSAGQTLQSAYQKNGDTLALSELTVFGEKQTKLVDFKTDGQGNFNLAGALRTITVDLPNGAGQMQVKAYVGEGMKPQGQLVTQNGNTYAVMVDGQGKVEVQLAQPKPDAPKTFNAESLKTEGVEMTAQGVFKQDGKVMDHAALTPDRLAAFHLDMADENVKNLIGNLVQGDKECYISRDGTLFIQGENGYYTIGQNTFAGTDKQLGYVAQYTGNDLKTVALSNGNLIHDISATTYQVQQKDAAGNIYEGFYARTSNGGELQSSSLTLAKLGNVTLQYDAKGNLTNYAQLAAQAGSKYAFAASASGFTLKGADGAEMSFSNTGRATLKSEGGTGGGDQKLLEFDVVTHFDLSIAKLGGGAEKLTVDQTSKESVTLQISADGQSTKTTVSSDIFGTLAYKTVHEYSKVSGTESKWVIKEAFGTTANLAKIGVHLNVAQVAEANLRLVIATNRTGDQLFQVGFSGGNASIQGEWKGHNGALGFVGGNGGFSFRATEAQLRGTPEAFNAKQIAEANAKLVLDENKSGETVYSGGMQNGTVTLQGEWKGHNGAQGYVGKDGSFSFLATAAQLKGTPEALNAKQIAEANAMLVLNKNSNGETVYSGGVQNGSVTLQGEWKGHNGAQGYVGKNGSFSFLATESQLKGTNEKLLPEQIAEANAMLVLGKNSNGETLFRGGLQSDGSVMLMGDWKNHNGAQGYVSGNGSFSFRATEAQLKGTPEELKAEQVAEANARLVLDNSGKATVYLGGLQSDGSVMLMGEWKNHNGAQGYVSNNGSFSFRATEAQLKGTPEELGEKQIAEANARLVLDTQGKDVIYRGGLQAGGSVILMGAWKDHHGAEGYVSKDGDFNFRATEAQLKGTPEELNAKQIAKADAELVLDKNSQGDTIYTGGIQNKNVVLQGKWFGHADSNAHFATANIGKDGNLSFRATAEQLSGTKEALSREQIAGAAAKLVLDKNSNGEIVYAGGVQGGNVVLQGKWLGHQDPGGKFAEANIGKDGNILSFRATEAQLRNTAEALSKKQVSEADAKLTLDKNADGETIYQGVLQNGGVILLGGLKDQSGVQGYVGKDGGLTTGQNLTVGGKNIDLKISTTGGASQIVINGTPLPVSMSDGVKVTVNDQNKLVFTDKLGRQETVGLDGKVETTRTQGIKNGFENMVNTVGRAYDGFKNNMERLWKLLDAEMAGSNSWVKDFGVVAVGTFAALGEVEIYVAKSAAAALTFGFEAFGKGVSFAVEWMENLSYEGIKTRITTGEWSYGAQTIDAFTNALVNVFKPLEEHVLEPGKKYCLFAAEFYTQKAEALFDQGGTGNIAWGVGASVLAVITKTTGENLPVVILVFGPVFVSVLFEMVVWSQAVTQVARVYIEAAFHTAGTVMITKDAVVSGLGNMFNTFFIQPFVQYGEGLSGLMSVAFGNQAPGVSATRATIDALASIGGGIVGVKFAKDMLREPMNEGQKKQDAYQSQRIEAELGKAKEGLQADLSSGKLSAAEFGKMTVGEFLTRYASTPGEIISSMGDRAGVKLGDMVFKKDGISEFSIKEGLKINPDLVRNLISNPGFKLMDLKQTLPDGSSKPLTNVIKPGDVGLSNSLGFGAALGGASMGLVTSQLAQFKQIGVLAEGPVKVAGALAGKVIDAVKGSSAFSSLANEAGFVRMGGGKESAKIEDLNRGASDGKSDKATEEKTNARDAESNASLGEQMQEVFGTAVRGYKDVLETGIEQAAGRENQAERSLRNTETSRGEKYEGELATSTDKDLARAKAEGEELQEKKKELASLLGETATPRDQSEKGGTPGQGKTGVEGNGGSSEKASAKSNTAKQENPRIKDLEAKKTSAEERARDVRLSEEGRKLAEVEARKLDAEITAEKWKGEIADLEKIVAGLEKSGKSPDVVRKLKVELDSLKRKAGEFEARANAGALEASKRSQLHDVESRLKSAGENTLSREEQKSLQKQAARLKQDLELCKRQSEAARIQMELGKLAENMQRTTSVAELLELLKQKSNKENELERQKGSIGQQEKAVEKAFAKEVGAKLDNALAKAKVPGESYVKQQIISAADEAAPKDRARQLEIQSAIAETIQRGEAPKDIAEKFMNRDGLKLLNALQARGLSEVLTKMLSQMGSIKKLTPQALEMLKSEWGRNQGTERSSFDYKDLQAAMKKLFGVDGYTSLREVTARDREVKKALDGILDKFREGSLSDADFKQAVSDLVYKDPGMESAIQEEVKNARPGATREPVFQTDTYFKKVTNDRIRQEVPETIKSLLGVMRLEQLHDILASKNPLDALRNFEQCAKAGKGVEGQSVLDCRGANVEALQRRLDQLQTKTAEIWRQEARASQATEEGVKAAAQEHAAYLKNELRGLQLLSFLKPEASGPMEAKERQAKSQAESLLGNQRTNASAAELAEKLVQNLADYQKLPNSVIFGFAEALSSLQKQADSLKGLLDARKTAQSRNDINALIKLNAEIKAGLPDLIKAETALRDQARAKQDAMGTASLTDKQRVLLASLLGNQAEVFGKLDKGQDKLMADLYSSASAKEQGKIWETAARLDQGVLDRFVDRLSTRQLQEAGARFPEQVMEALKSRIDRCQAKMVVVDKWSASVAAKDAELQAARSMKNADQGKIDLLTSEKAQMERTLSAHQTELEALASPLGEVLSGRVDLDGKAGRGLLVDLNAPVYSRALEIRAEKQMASQAGKGVNGRGEASAAGRVVEMARTLESARIVKPAVYEIIKKFNEFCDKQQKENASKENLSSADKNQTPKAEDFAQRLEAFNQQQPESQRLSGKSLGLKSGETITRELLETCMTRKGWNQERAAWKAQLELDQADSRLAQAKADGNLSGIMRAEMDRQKVLDKQSDLLLERMQGDLAKLDVQLDAVSQTLNDPTLAKDQKAAAESEKTMLDKQRLDVLNDLITKFTNLDYTFVDVNQETVRQDIANQVERAQKPGFEVRTLNDRIIKEVADIFAINNELFRKQGIDPETRYKQIVFAYKVAEHYILTCKLQDVPRIRQMMGGEALRMAAGYGKEDGNAVGVFAAYNIIKADTGSAPKFLWSTSAPELVKQMADNRLMKLLGDEVTVVDKNTVIGDPKRGGIYLMDQKSATEIMLEANSGNKAKVDFLKSFDAGAVDEIQAALSSTPVIHGISGEILDKVFQKLPEGSIAQVLFQARLRTEVMKEVMAAFVQNGGNLRSGNEYGRSLQTRKMSVDGSQREVYELKPEIKNRVIDSLLEMHPDLFRNVSRDEMARLCDMGADSIMKINGADYKGEWETGEFDYHVMGNGTMMRHTVFGNSEMAAMVAIKENIMNAFKAGEQSMGAIRDAQISLEGTAKRLLHFKTGEATFLQLMNFIGQEKFIVGSATVAGNYRALKELGFRITSLTDESTVSLKDRVVIEAMQINGADRAVGSADQFLFRYGDTVFYSDAEGKVHESPKTDFLANKLYEEMDKFNAQMVTDTDNGKHEGLRDDVVRVLKEKGLNVNSIDNLEKLKVAGTQGNVDVVLISGYSAEMRAEMLDLLKSQIKNDPGRKRIILGMGIGEGSNLLAESKNGKYNATVWKTNLEAYDKMAQTVRRINAPGRTEGTARILIDVNNERKFTSEEKAGIVKLIEAGQEAQKAGRLDEAAGKFQAARDEIIKVSRNVLEEIDNNQAAGVARLVKGESISDVVEIVEKQGEPTAAEMKKYAQTAQDIIAGMEARSKGLEHLVDQAAQEVRVLDKKTLETAVRFTQQQAGLINSYYNRFKNDDSLDQAAINNKMTSLFGETWQLKQNLAGIQLSQENFYRNYAVTGENAFLKSNWILPVTNFAINTILPKFNDWKQLRSASQMVREQVREAVEGAQTAAEIQMKVQGKNNGDWVYLTHPSRNLRAGEARQQGDSLKQEPLVRLLGRQNLPVAPHKDTPVLRVWSRVAPALAASAVLFFASFGTLWTAQAAQGVINQWIEPVTGSLVELPEVSGTTVSAPEQAEAGEMTILEQWKQLMGADRSVKNAVETLQKLLDDNHITLSVGAHGKSFGHMYMTAALVSLLQKTKMPLSPIFNSLAVGVDPKEQAMGKETVVISREASGFFAPQRFEEVFFNQIALSLAEHLTRFDSALLEKVQAAKTLPQFEALRASTDAKLLLAEYIKNYIMKGDALRQQSGAGELYQAVKLALGNVEFSEEDLNELSLAALELEKDGGKLMAGVFAELAELKGDARTAKEAEFNERFGLAPSAYVKLAAKPIGLRLMQFGWLKVITGGEKTLRRDPFKAIDRTSMKFAGLGLAAGIAAGIAAIALAPVFAAVLGLGAVFALAASGVLLAQRAAIVWKVNPTAAVMETLLQDKNIPPEVKTLLMQDDGFMRAVGGLTVPGTLQMTSTENYNNAICASLNVFARAIGAEASVAKQAALSQAVSPVLGALHFAVKTNISGMSSGVEKLNVQLTPVVQPAQPLLMNNRFIRSLQQLDGLGVKINIPAQWQQDKPMKLKSSDSAA